MIDRVARPEISIPVAVDADRMIDGEEMSRVTFFVITTDAPGAEWQIPLPHAAPLEGVGALGVVGVVYRAIRADRGGSSPSDADLFFQPSDIAALFDLEGAGSPLSIQLEDVWVPTRWLRTARVWGSETSSGRSPERGLVYRIGLATFQASYRYTAGDIDLDALLAIDSSGEVFFSPVETESVRAWAQGEIDQARRRFPSKEMKLRYRKADQIDV